MALTLANRLSLPAILGRAPHWLAQNAVARKALWYADFRRGQFARNGLARGFPQMGSFSSAGMRYEQTASGLLVPRGVDEPRLADYSTGARRLLMEGPKSKEPIVSIPAEVTTGNPATWNATSLTDANLGTTLAPDGEAEVAVWNMQNRAVYWQVSGLTVGLAYTQSVWVKCSPEGIGETLYLRKPGVVSSPFGLNDLDRYGRITLDGTWQRITATRVVGSGETTFNYLFENRLSQGASGTGYGLAIWGANLEEGAHATSVVHDQGSGAARAPDLFAADVSGFDLSGGFWVSLNCRAEVTAGEDQALLRLAGSGGDFCDILSPSAGADLLRVRQRAGMATNTLQTAHSYGTGLRMAALFRENELRLVYAGADAGLDISAPVSVPDTLYLAALDGDGASKPARVAYETLWIAPAAAFSLDDMKELTA